MSSASSSIPIIGTAASTVMNYDAQTQSASAIKFTARRKLDEANFEASQLEQDAGQAKAVAQRQAADLDQQTRMVNSAALARAAASGAGASDPSVLMVLAKTAAVGAYRHGVALYEGEEQAKTDRLRATALRRYGDVGIADAALASRAANQAANVTLLTGGTKGAAMYSKYWTGPTKAQQPEQLSGPGSLDAGNEPEQLSGPG